MYIMDADGWARREQTAWGDRPQVKRPRSGVHHGRGRVGPTRISSVGGPPASKEAAKRCTSWTRTGGPDANKQRGGTARK